MIIGLVLLMHQYVVLLFKNKLGQLPMIRISMSKSKVEVLTYSDF